MIDGAPSQNLAALEARHASLTSQRDGLNAQVTTLDAAIAEVQPLADEVEARIKAQEGAVARAMLAAGRPISFGRDYDQRTVRWTDGRGTVQLSGPRPLDSPQGQADRERHLYDALVAEAVPVRSTLASLQQERNEAVRTAGLLSGALNPLEVQIARIRAEEGEREALIGERLTWRDRLAAILRRTGVAGIGG